MRFVIFLLVFSPFSFLFLCFVKFRLNGKRKNIEEKREKEEREFPEENEIFRLELFFPCLLFGKEFFFLIFCFWFCCFYEKKKSKGRYCFFEGFFVLSRKGKKIAFGSQFCFSFSFQKYFLFAIFFFVFLNG